MTTAHLFLLQFERFQIDLNQENRSKLQGFIIFRYIIFEICLKKEGKNM